MTRAPFALALMLAAMPALACGKERWPVKVATDPDAAQISPVTVDASIGELGRMAVPPDPNQRQAARWPGETVIYRVSGTLTLIKREGDGDYHMVLTSAFGDTMIAEAPDPDCARGSRFGAEIAAVYQTVRERFLFGPKRPDLLVTVTGVWFADRLHNQTGHAPNGAELHPVLSIMVMQ